MKQARIQLKDSTMDVIVKMSDGDPGAMTTLMEILKNGETIDPDGVMGGLGPILLLDTFEIYGTDIYVLWSDICGRKINKMLAVLRACQLGMFSPSILKDACSRQDYSGKEMVSVEELYLKVKKQLPKFDCN